MNDIIEFFSNIFEANIWPARWYCGYWSDFHGWLYIFSDLSIWAAYFTIPIIIVKYVSQKKHSVRFEKAYFWFAAFILACGFTHLLDAGIFWIPMYRLSALIRFITAVVSWLTVYHLVKILPKAFSLKTSDQLEEEVKRREEVVENLEASNAKLSTQKAFIEKIFNSTTDYINVFDTNLNFISVNKCTEDFLNISAGELIGKNFSEIFPSAVDKDYHQILKSAAAGKLITDKINKTDSNRHYRTSFTPLFENDIQYAVLVISRDITESVAKENALKILNSELKEKNDKLQKVNSELEQFAYILSHDLQEPLRKIQTFSNIVIQKNTELTESRAYLEKIDSSAKRMKQLIQDVLEYSKIDDKVDAFKPINLNEVIEKVKADLELSITQKKAVIVSAYMPEIVGIEYQITQVFYNLLSNSIKYCTVEPCIEISHRLIEREDDKAPYLELTFKDNGIGFENEYKDDIFILFRRLQHRGVYEGTGIGLALVKKIVATHTGSISATSVLGKGSTFVLTLPRS